MKSSIKSLLCLCCFLPILITVLESDSRAADSIRPNVIFIMADDLGWGDVDFHGGSTPTPRLTELKRESLELTQHYVAPVCSPTRAGLLTGRFWSRFGVTTPTNTLALPPETQTLASVLQDNGYDTCLVGKWHLGSKAMWGPGQFGFDYAYGSLAGGISPWNHRYKKGPYSHTWHRNGQLVDEIGHVTDLLTDEAVDWIQRRGDKPFFLYVPFTAVHLPLKEPKKWLDRVSDAVEGEVARHYAASIMHLDDSVGRILDALENKGMSRQTLVVFTSDNGGSTAENNDLKYPDDDCPSGRLVGNNKPFRGQKGTVYEGGIRVPTLVRLIDRIPPGSNSTPVQITDWMPTVCSMVGIQPVHDLNWDGTDLSRLLLERKPLKSRPLYIAGPGNRSVAVRYGDYKLIVNQRNKEPGVELFDISIDSREQHNLADSRPEKVEQLRQLLVQISKKDRDSVAAKEPVQQSLISAISIQTLWENRDGQSRTWFHPRACMVPDSNGKPVALMNLQEIGGSDYFGPVHSSVSTDGGWTWSVPSPIAAFGRQPVDGRADGLKAAVCDVTPQYHPQTNSVIALGHVVFYKGEYFARNEQLGRYPVYAVRSKEGAWSNRKILQWDDPRGTHIYTNNCGQRVIMPDGQVQMSFTFGPKAENRMVAGVRAKFDGEKLSMAEVGPPLSNPVGRGLLEPSVVKFREQFWMTIRAEDQRGYVTTSEDGINWKNKKAWAWDDGTPLTMSTTQQHWLAHSDALYLVYTRKDASNQNVIRWRAPLWIARVDTEAGCLIRTSEQVLIPLSGDGVNDPDKVALMGNFNVTHASADESWVTVGEWMPRNGYRGNVLLARIHWAKPNRRPLW